MMYLCTNLYLLGLLRLISPIQMDKVTLDAIAKNRAQATDASVEKKAYCATQNAIAV